MTVRELLTGERAPLSQAEFANWNTYYKVKQFYQEDAQREKDRNERPVGR